MPPFLRGRWRSWQADFFALVATAATFALRFALDGLLGGQPTLVVFTLPIMASAYLGGLRAGLLATAASCLAANYYLLPPIHSFAIGSEVACWQLFLVALTGMFISGLSEALHRMRFRLERAMRELRTTHQSLCASDARLRAYVEQAADCMSVHDAFGRLLDVNPQTCVSLGYTREELLRMDRREVESTFDLAHAQEAWRRMIPGQPRILAGRLRRKDGSSFPIEARLGSFDLEGQRCFFAMSRDTTERHIYEFELNRRSRLYAALSQVNQAIVWTPRQDELLQKVCRVLVEDGGFRMAWIGWHDPAHRSLVPVAHWGAGGDFLQDSRILVDGEPDSGGPVATAFAEQRACFVNDVSDNPGALQWRSQLQQLGICAVAALPIRENGQVVGIIVVYADKAHFFQDEEIALLKEAALDISFALDNFRLREAAEQAAEQTARLAAIVQSSDDAVVSKDLNGIVTSWNPGAEKLFGYTAAEMIGQSILRLIPPERHHEEEMIISHVLRGETLRRFDTVRRRQDGGLIDISVTISPIRDGTGKIVGCSKLARDITEEKKAGDQLKRSEASLANAQRIARIGNWDLDIATGALSWSAEIYRIFGLSPAEFGASFNAFMATVHPEDRAGLEVAHSAAVAGEAQLDFEHRIVRPDGTVRIVHELADLMRDNTGQPVRLAGTVQDVTERKQVEAKLRESTEAFSTAFRASAMAMVIATLDGRYVEVNPAFCNLVGIPQEEILGRTATELGILQPSGRQEIIRTFERTGGVLSALEFDLHHRDGTTRTVMGALTGISLRGARHRLFTAIDVTEHRRAESALRESEVRYRRLFESAKDGILIVNAETGLVDDVNPFLVNLLGTSREDLIGKQVSDLESLPSILEKENLTWRLHDGQVMDVEVVSNTYPVSGSRMVQFNVRDVTARRRAEEELLQLNATLEKRVAERTAQLELANRELAEHASAISRDLRVAKAADQTKSTFLAAMSHELRTPLNSIIGFTGIVLKGMAGPLNEEQTKQLGMVRSSARHLLELINDVLDLSKIEAGQLEMHATPFDLRASVERVVASVTPQAQKKALALSANLSPELGEIISDQRRVEQILLNLLNNAIKFTDHGSVTITVDLLAIEASPAPCTVPRPSVRFRIADTGIGIAKEYLTLLFQPFRQLDSGLARQSEGTGLGLVICRHLATMLGGEITVVSEPARGSEFTLILPLQKTP